MQKLGIIGNSMYTSALASVVSENKDIELIGYYNTDENQVNVFNNQKVSTSFGLMGLSDWLIFTDCTDKNYNLLLEAIRAFKKVLLLDPMQLKLFQIDALSKTLREADTPFFVFPGYPALVLHETEMKSGIFFVEIIRKHSFDKKGTMGSQLMKELLFARSIISHKIRHASLHAVDKPVMLGNFLLLTIDFDNGSLLKLEYRGIEKKANDACNIFIQNSVYKLSCDEIYCTLMVNTELKGENQIEVVIKRDECINRALIRLINGKEKGFIGIDELREIKTTIEGMKHKIDI